MELWQQLWAKEAAEGLKELTVDCRGTAASRTAPLGSYSGEDAESPDVSMVSRSFSPSVRRTHRSRFGSEVADALEDSEQNSVVRFLQIFLLTCCEATS